MAKFVKKISNTKYYEINGIRAAGIVPYYIKNGNVYILINKEFRDRKILYNCIGGKVDFFDKNILQTAVREFDEETGYLACDLLQKIINEKYIEIDLKKPKYKSFLININEELDWKLLPYNYSKIFKDIEIFNDRDSLELIWINLFNFNSAQKSYLLSLLIYNIKSNKNFSKYDKNIEPLFLPD